MILDIGAKNGFPSNELSNFAAHSFFFDGVHCASMEGLLQSLKFDKPHIQAEVCKLVGFAAKKRGKDRNDAWKSKQVLWWKGVEFPRDSKEYQILLDQMYMAVAEQCPKFVNALLSTKDAVLTHDIGRTKEKETILTRHEFCSRLTILRHLLQLDADLSAFSYIHELEI